MARFRDRERRHFPLKDIPSVVELFKEQLRGPDEPNLTLLSIVLGCIENVLTLNRSVSTSEASSCVQYIFPIVDLDLVEALYVKFETLVKGSVDLSNYPSGYSNRDLVKKISDVIWSSLSRSFKDRAHLQSLYSFLTGNKLDCFGVSFGVVAAAQILGRSDIHLALSEDHAWVVFGEDGTDTAEVTWHGKGNEDKRGQSIALSVPEKSWLYLNGHPVTCNRRMEVAAIVSSINPAINVSMDSIEMGALQRELLWLLYDNGLLEKYPMGLGNLGDLEEISPTPGRHPPLAIFQECIASAVKHYDNHHVYPYTYMGGYLYRKQYYKDAIRYWAQASDVIRKFNYTREDEEIYKEFLEIATELIPNIVKAVSQTTTDPAEMSVLYNPEAYADILRFYDGICEWEEGSSTPVLHVGWAQNLTFSLNKFDPLTRAKIDVGKDEENDEDEEKSENDENDQESEYRFRSRKDSELGNEKQSFKTKDGMRDSQQIIDDSKKEDHRPSSPQTAVGQRTMSKARKCQRRRNSGTARSPYPDIASEKTDGKTNKEEQKIKSTIEELASKIGQQECNLNTAPNPNITALAQQCSLNILNKDYLLGAGEPFSSPTTMSETVTTVETPVCTPNTTDNNSSGPKPDADEILNLKSNGLDSAFKIKANADQQSRNQLNDVSQNVAILPASPATASDTALGSVLLELRSEKMKGLKKMFKSSKLNASAIKLQLTAQSQVHVKDSRFLDLCESTGSARKRARRDIV